MFALTIIDIQNDFLDNKKFETYSYNNVFHHINCLIESFDNNKSSIIIGCVDYHPKNHCSFKINGGIWPEHCVQETDGFKITNKINYKKIMKIIKKGYNPDVENYSLFHNEESNLFNLMSYLNKNNVKVLYIVGMIIEFCVIESALDAIKNNLSVIVDMKGCWWTSKENVKNIINKYKDKIIFINTEVLNY